MYWRKMQPYFRAVENRAKARAVNDIVSTKAHHADVLEVMQTLEEEATWNEKARLREIDAWMEEKPPEAVADYVRGYKDGSGGESAMNDLGEAYLAGYIAGHFWWKYTR